MFTTAPPPASAAGLSSGAPCRTRRRPSTSAGGRAPVTSMSRPGRIVNIAGIVGVGQYWPTT